MKVIWILLAFLSVTTYGFSDKMEDTLKVGKEEAKIRSDEVQQAIKKIDVEILKNDLTPAADRGKTFDADSARQMSITNQTPKSEVRDHLISPDVQRNIKENKLTTQDDYFLESSQAILDQIQSKLSVNEKRNYLDVKCIEALDLVPITIDRSLQVTVVQPPPKLSQKKVCDGHREKIEWFYDNSDPKKELAKFKKICESSPSIKSVIFEEPHYHTYKISVWYSFKHADDAADCTCSHIENYHVPSDPQEVDDEWVYGDSKMLSLIQSPDCTLVKQDCIDLNEERVINGKTVKRKCWSEKLSLMCRYKSNSDCTKIKGKKCDLIGRNCIESDGKGCILWELIYRCYTQTERTFGGGIKDVALVDGENWVVEYEPNNSLPEVAAKLAVFEEIEKEMQGSQDVADNIQIFDAKKIKCSKTIASDLIYDCCFSHSGLVKQIGLAKCNSDEVMLADMRGQGLCYYVGHYSEKKLGVKIEDKHVYCCFKSKLAKTVNEEGRLQLGRDWGTPKKPDCRGFSIEEIGKLDFSKLDLGEICDDYAKKLPQNLQERLGDFQNRLKNKIETNPQELSGSDNLTLPGDYQSKLADYYAEQRLNQEEGENEKNNDQ